MELTRRIKRVEIALGDNGETGAQMTFDEGHETNGVFVRTGERTVGLNGGTHAQYPDGLSDALSNVAARAVAQLQALQASSSAEIAQLRDANGQLANANAEKDVVIVDASARFAALTSEIDALKGQLARVVAEANADKAGAADALAAANAKIHELKDALIAEAKGRAAAAEAALAANGGTAES